MESECDFFKQNVFTENVVKVIMQFSKGHILEIGTKAHFPEEKAEMYYHMTVDDIDDFSFDEVKAKKIADAGGVLLYVMPEDDCRYQPGVIGDGGYPGLQIWKNCKGEKVIIVGAFKQIDLSFRMQFPKEPTPSYSPTFPPEHLCYVFEKVDHIDSGTFMGKFAGPGLGGIPSHGFYPVELSVDFWEWRRAPPIIIPAKDLSKEWKKVLAEYGKDKS